MELLVRVRWRRAAPADLRIEVEPYHTALDVLDAASERCDAHWDPAQPVYLERLATVVPLDEPILGSGIVSGDTLRFDLFGVDAVDHSQLLEAVSCDVTAGPEAGRSFVLAPGRHAVGRSSAGEVVLDDLTVSAHHLDVVVADDLTTRLVPDPEARNPLTINGRATTEPVTVGPTDVVQFGATAIALRVFGRSFDTERDQLGQVPFRRTPYKPVVVSERTFKALGRVPGRPEKQPFSPLPALLPILLGLGMFAITQSPQMLMMMAMSPVMLVARSIETRKTGTARFTEQVAELDERLARRAAEVDAALLAERAERISQSPDLADLARRAMLRTLDLWPRQRRDADFLRTRLGVGTVESKVRVEPETSGDERLVDAVNSALAGHRRLPAAPIAINLCDLGVLALHGGYADVRAMCSSVLIQAATLHSPEDLVIVVLEGHDRGLGTWAKWLPHTRSASSPVGGECVIDDPEAAAEMVRQLISVAQLRTADERADHRWPWVLVVVDDSAAIDPALASQLFEHCPAAGMSAVVCVDSDARVPRQAAATFRCVPVSDGAMSSVWFTEPDVPGEEFEPEPANARLIDRLAMSLAPLRDATSANATTALPRVVPLLSLFGAEVPTVASITRGWTAPKPYGLRAPIGIGPSGPLVLDLVEHGPHALIGGTSGAGKSELLQSMVSSLIHEYPPSRLTFLFVDYKGGAATEVFNTVPHTVGYVTNLDASLSLRALTSLRAELNHRMRLMEGKAKDLAEMLERFPDEAPPSLVIVVDEFATLVKEVPDFVAGMVDIAQRGRSLGVHLILATQRPSGSVNDNILANTNLRISLRMLDAGESKTVIGVGAAADIPLPLKGRGFAKLGPQDLVEFQSAYTGAALTREAEVSPVVVARFGNMPRPGAGTLTLARGRRTTQVTVDGTGTGAWPRARSLTPLPAPRSSEALPPPRPEAPPRPIPAPEISGDRSTHLDVLLDAVRGASSNWPAPRKPWREMLPEVLDLASVEPPPAAASRAGKGRLITLGLLDDPAAQAQFPAVFDLEESGGLLIAGSGGSGKSSALRSAAVSAIAGATPDEVTLFVFDCASRSLAALRALPHVAMVATGDDLESMSRAIAVLGAELDRRRPLLADLGVQAENLTAYLDQGHAMTRIVVLIDGFQNVGSILDNTRPAVYGPLDFYAELQRIITDGRQLGIHTIAATDRRQPVPSMVMSALGDRLVLRQNDEMSYADYSIPTALTRGIELPTGRAIWTSLLVQIGVVGGEPTAAGQGAAIAELAGSLDGVARTSLAPPAPPEVVEVPLEATGPTRCTLGRIDVSGEVVEVDVAHTGLLVVGPPRSGRSTALRQVARSLVANGYGVWTAGVDGVGGSGRHAPAKADPMLELLEDFAAMCETRRDDRPLILVVDDADRYDQPAIAGIYERIVKAERSRLIGALELRNLAGYTQNTLLLELRREPTVLMLRPDSAGDVLQTTGVRAQLRPGLPLGPGRGILIRDREPFLLQVAQA